MLHQGSLTAPLLPVPTMAKGGGAVAEAAPVSKGTTAPFSPIASTFPQWLGTSHVDNSSKLSPQNARKYCAPPVCKTWNPLGPVSHLPHGEHPPHFTIMGMTEGEALPVPVWEECQLAEAALMSRGTTVPTLTHQRYLPQWLGTSNYRQFSSSA